MQNNQNQPVEILYSSDFKRNLRKLSKKYRRIKSDIQPLINKLVKGETPGTEIPKVGYKVFKVRVRNSNLKKGKRSGYRIIYYLKKQDRIILITIYSKTEQSDVSIEYIRHIIANDEAVDNEKEDSDS